MPGVVGPSWQLGRSAARCSRQRTVANPAAAAPSATLQIAITSLRIAAPPSLLGLELEREPRRCNRFADLHGLRPQAQRRVPGLDGVAARREAGELERAVGAGDRKSGVVLRDDIGVHPRVDVAHQVDHIAGVAGAIEHERGIARRCRLVPLLRAGDRAVHVVKRRVAVADRDLLADDDADHARRVHAVALVDHRWRDRRGGLVRRRAGLDPDQDILELAVGDDDVLGQPLDLGAQRIGEPLQRQALGRRALEHDDAFDLAAGGRGFRTGIGVRRGDARQGGQHSDRESHHVSHTAYRTASAILASPSARGGEFRYPRQVPEPAPPDGLRPPAWARTLEALPPALRHQVAELLAGTAAWPAVARAAEPWLAAEPSLAELGIWLVAARQPVELRRLGCRWLAPFPTAHTVARLVQLALHDAPPPPGPG